MYRGFVACVGYTFWSSASPGGVQHVMHVIVLMRTLQERRWKEILAQKKEKQDVG